MASMTETDEIAIFAGSRGTWNRGLGPEIMGAGEIMRPQGRENMGISVMVHGTQGRGKSSACEDVLEALGLRVETFQAGLTTPETFQGIGWMTTYEDINGAEQFGYEFRPNTRLGRACGLGRAVQIDDWLTAPKAVQVAAMGLFLDRKLQDLNFGDTPIVGTTNNDMATVTAQMNPANANRMGHVIWTGADADAYDESGGELQLTISVAKLKQLTMRNPDGTFTQESNELHQQLMAKAAHFVNTYKMRTLALGGGGIGAGPTAVYDLPPKTVQNPSKYAFATNRSYQILTCVLATGLHLDLDEDALGKLVASTIGEHRVPEMLDVLSHRNVPSLADFFAGKVKFDDHDISEVVAVMSMASHQFTSRAEAEVLFSTAREFYDTYPELCDLLGPTVMIVSRRANETSATALAHGRRPLGTEVIKAAADFKEEFYVRLGITEAHERGL